VKPTTHINSLQIISLITIFALAGAGFLVESRGAFAAPPAEASATSPTKDATHVPSPSLTFQALAPNLLARTLFSNSDAGPIGVEIVDIVVGPGQTAQLATAGFAALIDVQAGSARVSIGGKLAELQPNGIFNVAEGQGVEIDNSGGTRPFLARAYKLSATGK
jgi:hypothetical protein